jgi:hypothetical protein
MGDNGLSAAVPMPELNIDMAAKRHKKHKNKISGFVISMG